MFAANLPFCKALYAAYVRGERYTRHHSFSVGMEPNGSPAGGYVYGGGFSSGFEAFLQSSSFSDVTIVTPDGREHRLHALLLARSSEFFSKALTADFVESKTRTIHLEIDKGLAHFPTVIRYFYSDIAAINGTNVLPLLSLARQLLVASLESYCTAFLQQHLNKRSCLAFLRDAVKHSLSDVASNCVAIFAKSFPLLYDADTSGLPPSIILKLLDHADLQVNCELQVRAARVFYLRLHLTTYALTYDSYCPYCRCCVL